MKAIIVDGSSLNGMTKGAGMDRVIMSNLLSVLKGIGGNHNIYPEVIYTLPGRMRGGTIDKKAKTAGFSVSYYKDKGEDSLIHEQIRKVLGLGVLKSLVLVSADQDFIPTIRKHRRGEVKVTIVATKKIERNGRCPLSREYIRLLDTGEFNFVEITAYAEKITSERVAVGLGKKFSLEIGSEETNPDIQDQIEKTIRELLKTIPGLSFRKI